MKIATFNINNVNRRLANLLDWLVEAEPDAVCLQELKAAEDRFPAEALEDAGYAAVWLGETRWNGVAILARDRTPVLTRTALPGHPADHQSRYIEAAGGGILIGCLYAPNGNPRPGPKFDYKLAWNEWLIAHAAQLVAADVPVVLAGDYSIAPEPRDVYPTRSYDDNSLIQLESRAAFRRLQGWLDAIRTRHPAEAAFSFWDYRRKRWPRDAGLRLDHILLSPALAPRVVGAGIDRNTRGRDNASDHAPVWAVIN